MIVIALYFIAVAFAAVAAWLSMDYKTPSLNGWMAFAVLFMLVLIRVVDKQQRRIAAMKSLMMIALVLLCAAPAVADVKLDFKDGTSTVWSAYYVRGAQYCTDLGYGEYCINKTDVKKIAEVSEGTEGSEYSVSALGDEQAAKRREEYGQVLSQGEAQARRDQKAKRDRDMKASEGQIFKKKPAW